MTSAISSAPLTASPTTCAAPQTLRDATDAREGEALSAYGGCGHGRYT